MTGDERRKGFGSALLALTLQKARSRGSHDVLLTSDSDSLASIRIIEKMGGEFLGVATSVKSAKQVNRYRIAL